MDADQRIVKDPNLRVQQTMAMVFSRFEVLGSIRQTHRWFHEERIELPVNKAVRGRFELRWQLPTMSIAQGCAEQPAVRRCLRLWPPADQGGHQGGSDDQAPTQRSRARERGRLHHRSP